MAEPMCPLEALANEERAKSFQEKTPSDLSFEEVVKNTALPPCSLNDFMDYLVYVERNAEPLQFFLWYCDYVDRWSKLLPRQKALAPVWDASRRPDPEHVRYSHRRAKSERLTKILGIMEREAKQAQDEHEHPWRPSVESHKRSQSSASCSSTWSPLSSLGSPVEPHPDFQPFTIQPLRDEVTRVVRHYISESSPRQLNLTPEDRGACLEAVQHTTHPSALLPAFLVVEATLRGQLHPAFIRRSVANSNRPHLMFLRILGITLAVLGFALDTVLILSHLSHFLRVICLLLWWPGFTTVLAAARGLCLILHFRGRRHVRPWEEQDFPSEPDEKLSDVTSDTDSELAAPAPAVLKGSSTVGRIMGGFHHHSRSNSSSPHHHVRKETASSVSAFGGVDPLRKPALSTFGPSNEPATEAWARAYAARPLARRVFEASVPSRNRSLQVLQDRAVFLAVLWGGLAATGLAVASLFVPNGNFF